MRFFELSIARKYLIPKKKQLSVSLIALMSVGVISLVVWLLLLFLSVTEGMEKNWLDKLTTLNAPIKISPTPEYYSSYYYLIDANTNASNFTYKTIREKCVAPQSDPYSPEEDWELPSNLPPADTDANGTFKDPVKKAFAVLSNAKEKNADLNFQDVEMTGSLMRLEMHRPRSQKITLKGDGQGRFVTQASIISSHTENSPSLAKLILPPTADDLNHLFYRANHAAQFQEKLKGILQFVRIQKLKPSQELWRLPFTFLDKNVTLKADGMVQNGNLLHLVLPASQQATGTLAYTDGQWLFSLGKNSYIVSESTPLLIPSSSSLEVRLDEGSLLVAKELSDLTFTATLTIQGKSLNGSVHWDGLEVASAVITSSFDRIPSPSPPWAYSVKKDGKTPFNHLPQGIEKATPILLPKNFQASGGRIGDEGYFSIGGSTASSVQQQRLPFYVAGFYDPGILSIGNRCALAPSELITAMNAASNFTNVDKLSSNGIQVWFTNLNEAEKIKHDLESAFKEAGIGSYWTINTFREFDFAKDLLQQFESDKRLFSLIGIIILIVGCSNIISLLVLLVNDKKKEIGVLQSMGASSFSIALIFGICGVILGLFSSILGAFAALFTLHHIDSVVGFLSFFQGFEAFNAMFYGDSLPNTLSADAARFILIATPLISLCAGLIPAIKACRLRPSAILRGET